MLGDLVGYGADPNAVIERVRGLPTGAIIRGNHDKVAAGLDWVEGFNYLARQAIEWTIAALTPREPRMARGAAARAGARSTTSWRSATARRSTRTCTCSTKWTRCARFDRRSAPLCLFGHTHVPAIFRSSGQAPDGVARPEPRLIEFIGPPRGGHVQYRCSADVHYLVNCGAVGQPRDGDPRAAYGIVDTEARTLTTMRVEYDITSAQRRSSEAGLPEILAKRLAVGTVVADRSLPL